jgi:hypothetical protein
MSLADGSAPHGLRGARFSSPLESSVTEEVEHDLLVPFPLSFPCVFFLKKKKSYYETQSSVNIILHHLRVYELPVPNPISK